VIKTDLFTAPIPYAVRFIKFFVIAVFVTLGFASNAMSQEPEPRCNSDITSECGALVEPDSLEPGIIPDSLVFNFTLCDTLSKENPLPIGLNIGLLPGRLDSQIALNFNKIKNFEMGFYDIWTHTNLSGAKQKNESFFLDAGRGPFDSTNVGGFLVVVDDGKAGCDTSYAGKFYLTPEDTLWFKHYALIANIDSSLVVKPGFDNNESVQLYKMILKKSTDQETQISLTKTADKKTVRTGDNVHYTLTLKNESSLDTIRTIVLTDVLPDSDSVILDQTSIMPPADTVIKNRTIIWKLDSLLPGDSTFFSYNVRVIATPPDTLINKSNVISSGGADSDSAVVVVVGEHDVSIEKTVEPDTVNCGQPFIYSIVAQNIGDGTARTVVVGDIMPDPVQFVRYISEPPGISDPNNDRGHIWNIGDLEPGESKLIQFEAVYPVEGDPSKNPLVNRACVISLNDFNPSNNCDTDTLWVKCPPLRCDCMLDRNVFEPEKTDPLRISFRLGAPGPVKLMILDITGYLITTLAEQDYTTGEHVFEWDGRRTEDGQKVGSGTYIVYFWSNNCDRLKKVILVR